MYKPNFDTSLKFDKALELLNKLNKHKLGSEADIECILFIYVELNDKIKNWLCNLGVNTAEFKGEIVDWTEEKKAIDITSIGSEVAYHYGHDLYYTGEKFVVRDKEKEELLEALKRANSFIDNGIKYGYIIEPEEPDKACETIKLIKKTIAKVEGAQNEKS